MTIDRETFEILLDTARVLRRKRRERLGRLLGFGKAASSPSSSPTVDARAIRLVTGLSQAKFAELLGIELATLRNWEQGRRQPTGPARALLRAIHNNPVEVIKALAG
jgi:putative transcriptional regulator